MEKKNRLKWKLMMLVQASLLSVIPPMVDTDIQQRSAVLPALSGRGIFWWIDINVFNNLLCGCIGSLYIAEEKQFCAPGLHH